VRLAREALAEQQHATERHTLELDAAEPELIGEWDARRMGRVLTNLVDNAVKYSPAGGTVVVRVRREQANAVLEVEDSGIGVPAADVSRIFDRFQRGSNVEGRVEGTGIGLASARHFVESHGGTIEVESQEHAGSVFRIRLPLSGVSS
jgi:signal transduction histidine kinase